jgi:hypothetical protein
MDEILYYLGNSLIYIASGLGTIIVIAVIASVVSNLKKGGHSVLILQEFIFNENEDVFLIIKGRTSGFWSWVLSLFDKAPVTRFTFNKRLLKYEKSKIKYYIPLIKINCVSSAVLYKFRIVFLILGIILFTAGIALPPSVEISYRIALVVVGIVLFVFSLLKKKTIHFGVYISENKPFISITLKKGIINSIGNETFEAAANTLNRIVLANAIAK